MRILPLFIASILPTMTLADSLVATRTIRPEEIVTSADIRLLAENIPGGYESPEEVLGMEARVALYAGRPIRRGDVQPPAVIGRNDLVELVYRSRGLEIVAAGRSLARGGVGEQITVLNTSSRRRVSGQVLPNGRVLVE